MKTIIITLEIANYIAFTRFHIISYGDLEDFSVDVDKVEIYLFI